MTYADFCLASQRADSVANDKTHFFSSYFSNPIGYFLFRLGMSPNNATFLFLLLGIACSAFIHLGMFVTAYVLWRLHIIVDMADGTIARATKTFSRSAMGFDRSNHIIINLLLLFTLTDGVWWLYQYTLICSFFLTYFFARNYYQEKQATQDLGLHKVLIKNCIGLEGFIVAAMVMHSVNILWLKNIIILYSISFFALYLYKLYLFRISQRA